MSSLPRSWVAAGRFDGIDVADEVGYGDVWGGQFFDEAVVGRHPCDGGFVTHLCDEVAAELRDRRIGVVAHLGAGDVRHLRVEQGGEGAKDARFCLAAETEEDEVYVC